MTLNLVPQLYPEAEHGLSVGQNGMGKTTTNLMLIRGASQTHPVLIVDPKGERKFAEFGPLVSDPTKLRLDRTEWYHPPESLATRDMLDWILWQVYLSGRSLYLYIDELTKVTGPQRAGRGLDNVLSRGRDRMGTAGGVHISCLMSTQAPVWIPGQCWRESKHFYVHRLLTAKDRKTTAEHLGDEFLTRPIPKYHFLYYEPTVMDRPRLVRIDLGSSAA
jgi:hypothetical protein